MSFQGEGVEEPVFEGDRIVAQKRHRPGMFLCVGVNHNPSAFIQVCSGRGLTKSGKEKKSKRNKSPVLS